MIEHIRVDDESRGLEITETKHAGILPLPRATSDAPPSVRSASHFLELLLIDLLQAFPQRRIHFAEGNTRSPESARSGLARCGCLPYSEPILEER